MGMYGSRPHQSTWRDAKARKAIWRKRRWMEQELWWPGGRRRVRCRWGSSVTRLSFLSFQNEKVRFEVISTLMRGRGWWRVSLTVCATHRGPFLKQTVTIAVDAAQDTLTRTLYATMSMCARAPSFQVVGAHKNHIHIWWVGSRDRRWVR